MRILKRKRAKLGLKLEPTQTDSCATIWFVHLFQLTAITDSFIAMQLQVVLTHGFSRVVLAVLLRAHSENKRFRVIVAESRPDSVGYLTARTLKEAGVPVTLTTDNAVAHIMHTVHLVLVGAEAVVESGGIVSRVCELALIYTCINLPSPPLFLFPFFLT